MPEHFEYVADWDNLPDILSRMKIGDTLLSYTDIGKIDGIYLREKDFLNDLDPDGDRISFYTYYYERVYTTDEYNKIMDEFEKSVQLDEWKEDARRQLVIAQAKKELMKTMPKEDFPVRRVALNISPQDHETHHKCMEVAKIISGMKFAKKKDKEPVVISGSYVIEQRSKDPEPPHGFHLHFNIFTKFPPSKVRQYVEQRLKTMKVTACVIAREANERWETMYMAGEKDDLEKNEKAKYDVVVRQLLGLQNKYEL